MGYYDKEQQVFILQARNDILDWKFLGSSYSKVVWLIHANGINVKTYFVILPISVLNIFSFKWIRATILIIPICIEIIMRIIILISKLIITVAIVLLGEVFEIFSHHDFMEIWEMMFTTFLFIIYLTFY